MGSRRLLPLDDFLVSVLRCAGEHDPGSAAPARLVAWDGGRSCGLAAGTGHRVDPAGSERPLRQSARCSLRCYVGFDNDRSRLDPGSRSSGAVPQLLETSAAFHGRAGHHHRRPLYLRWGWRSDALSRGSKGRADLALGPFHGPLHLGGGAHALGGWSFRAHRCGLAGARFRPGEVPLPRADGVLCGFRHRWICRSVDQSRLLPLPHFRGGRDSCC